MPSASACAASLKIFLDTMFYVTKRIALPKAVTRPIKFAEKLAEQAIITPRVRGIRDRYVETE